MAMAVAARVLFPPTSGTVMRQPPPSHGAHRYDAHPANHGEEPLGIEHRVLGRSCGRAELTHRGRSRGRHEMGLRESAYVGQFELGRSRVALRGTALQQALLGHVGEGRQCSTSVLAVSCAGRRPYRTTPLREGYWRELAQARGRPAVVLPRSGP
jgi:hypothetical protein